MGFLEDAKAKLTKAVDDHGDKIAGGIDKAADAIDARTGGKHSDKISGGAAKAKDALDRLDGKDDDIDTARPAHLKDETGPVQGQQGLTQPGPPTDPANPTG